MESPQKAEKWALTDWANESSEKAGVAMLTPAKAAGRRKREKRPEGLPNWKNMKKEQSKASISKQKQATLPLEILKLAPRFLESRRREKLKLENTDN